MKTRIKVGNFEISKSTPAFIIGELSCNHRGDIAVARKTIKAMADAGVNCMKLQTSKPNGITLNSDNDYFQIKSGTLWDGRTLYDLYSETYTPWEWHSELFQYAKELGLEFFSSPFDLEAVDFLNNLGVSAFKIASFEITDVPLIEKCARTMKPIFISTGIALKEDIDLAVETCLAAGNDQIILLKCTSAYPAPIDEANLANMVKMGIDYGCIVGISDHTMGHLLPVASVTMGGRVIEKHFILDRAIGGPDADFSMNPVEFKEMIDAVRMAESAIGSGEYVLSEKSMKNRQFSRSLFFTRDLKKGDVISASDIQSVRPGYGLPPKFFQKLIGRRLSLDVAFATPVSWESIEGGEDGK